ncbi:sensor histidine kinase [Sphingobacterium gobiense]|uniref:Signal transduction histidine kinase internal region domain-containing protein n=1 Tax=Sphingobacterium gobiense TaxID=1382456 RepID=A0A2S9JGB1_9SPHI|nr:histidine kinase [Sphingobacterium gobiense]PRD51994.1 hypothetical protein C5749_16995 [Sphingobacterium gobiense]
MINLNIKREHIGFWVLYGLYFYALNALGNEEMTIGMALLSLPFFVFVFYTVHYIIKRFFARRRYLSGTLMLACFYIFSSGLIYMLSYGQSGALVYGKYIVAGYEFSWREFLQTLLVLHGHFSILALLYFYYREKLRATQEKLAETERRLALEQQKVALEEQKKRYEYAALAAQVSPHMMANIFQNWKQELKALKPALGQQVDRLYHLMRFYMKADHADRLRTILLDDEVKAVYNYVEVRRGSLDRRFFIEFDITGNLLGFSVAPTTLLTLVENAFKHGEVHHPDFPIHVQVRTQRTGYRIVVENRKARVDKNIIRHGYGLKNLKRRLEILYGSQASITIKDTEEYYHVIILIKFKHLKHLQP